MSALSWLRRSLSWPPAPLFGPVFYYDLLRTSRRARYYLIRIGYALFLFAMLCWVYFVYAAGRDFRGTMRPTRRRPLPTHSSRCSWGFNSWSLSA